MVPIRVAIIGFGKIAVDQHIPSIRDNPRFDLVAGASPNSSPPDGLWPSPRRRPSPRSWGRSSSSRRCRAPRDWTSAKAA